MGQTKSMPQGLLGSRRAPQRQLERAEAERPKWGIKAVAALVLCLVHCNYGLYDVLTTAFGANPQASGHNVNPLLFSALRDLCGIPFLMGVASAWDMREIRLMPRKPDPKDVPAFICMSFFLYGNQGFNVLGLYLTDAPTAAFFQQTIPILTTFLSVLFGQEEMPNMRTRDGFPKVLGLILATLGAIGLIYFGHGVVVNESHLKRAMGEIALVCNCMSTSLYFVLQHRFVFSSPDPNRRQEQLRGLEKGVLRRWATTPLLVAAYTYMFSAIFSSATFLIQLVIARIVNPSTWHELLIVPLQGWIPILYAALIASTFAYALLTWVNKLLSPSITLGLIPLQPVSTAILSAIFLSMPLTVAQASSGAIVILGIIALLTSRQYQHERHEGIVYDETAPPSPPARVDAGAQTAPLLIVDSSGNTSRVGALVE